MSRRYTFECYDEEDQKTTRVEFDTDSHTWSGFDGPMYEFLNFLKGCGFVFHHEAEIGILDNDGEFRSSVE